MRTLASGVVASASGFTAIVSASVSLAAREAMVVMPFMTRPDPVPALLLFAFGTVLLVNGILLLLGVPVDGRAQGAAMVGYGALMVVVGLLMSLSTLFPMAMPMLSAALMYIFGGLMILLGGQMAVGRAKAMSNS
jgi:hypothetical protein